MLTNFARWRDWADRRPVLHGVVLNGAHLAVVLACLCKFLAAVVVFCAFFFAGMACWADTEFSARTLDAWINYLMRDHPGPLSLDARFSSLYTQGQLQGIQAHFDRVRDDYAVPFICAILVVVSLLYFLLCILRAYLIEGLKERRKNPGPVAQRTYALLLERARAELPPEFPATRLTIARETFVRQWYPGRVTMFLSNWLLVLLGKGRKDEFQFVLCHEAFHLRCLDPLVGIVSRSLMPILALLGAGATSDFLTENLVSRRAPWLNVMLSLTFFILFFRFFYRADFAFRRHKELLADRFAFMRHPAADLTLIYARREKRRTHPTRRERVLFLRRGAGATAGEAFISAQELTACGVLLISSRAFDDTMAMVPQMLEVPSFVLALLGTLVLGVEACAWPIPAAARQRLAARGGIVFLCAILASQHARTPWFSFLHIPLFGLILLRLARQERSEVTRPKVASGAAAPFQTALPAPERSSRIEAKVVLSVLSKTPSWIALASAIFGLWNSSVMLVLAGLFGEPLPSSLVQAVRGSFSNKQVVFNIVMYTAIIAVACVNIRRPNRLSLGLEWLFYASMAVFVAVFIAWLYSHGLAGFAKIFRELLNEGTPKLPQNQRLPGAVWGEAALLSIMPLTAISAFYFWRMRAVYSGRRKE